MHKLPETKRYNEKELLFIIFDLKNYKQLFWVKRFIKLDIIIVFNKLKIAFKKNKKQCSEFAKNFLNIA